MPSVQDLLWSSLRRASIPCTAAGGQTRQRAARFLLSCSCLVLPCSAEALCWPALQAWSWQNPVGPGCLTGVEQELDWLGPACHALALPHSHPANSPNGRKGPTLRRLRFEHWARACLTGVEQELDCLGPACPALALPHPHPANSPTGQTRSTLTGLGCEVGQGPD